MSRLYDHHILTSETINILPELDKHSFLNNVLENKKMDPINNYPPLVYAANNKMPIFHGIYDKLFNSPEEQWIRSTWSNDEKINIRNMVYNKALKYYKPNYFWVTLGACSAMFNNFSKVKLDPLSELAWWINIKKQNPSNFYNITWDGACHELNRRLNIGQYYPQPSSFWAAIHNLSEEQRLPYNKPIVFNADTTQMIKATLYGDKDNPINLIDCIDSLLKNSYKKFFIAINIMTNNRNKQVDSHKDILNMIRGNLKPFTNKVELLDHIDVSDTKASGMGYFYVKSGK